MSDFEEKQELGNAKNYSYKKITETHPAVLSEEMFTNTGGFNDGSYLVPHSREHFYESRKELGFLRNFYKHGVVSVYQDVFGRDILREYTGTTDGYELFVSDCTNSKKHLDDFEQEAIRLANTQGIVYVVMDNFKDSDIPVKRSEVIDNRRIPYLYLRRQTSVNWDLTKQDEFGNLVEIAFYEYDDAEGRQVYRIWTDTDWRDVVEINDETVVLESGEHYLGTIPVCPIMAGYKTNPVDYETVYPPYWDVCKVNFALYQIDSENRDNSRSSRFPMLFVQGIKATSLGIGTHSVLNIPDATETVTPPQWVEPNPQLYADARADAKALEETIFQMFGQSGIVGVQSSKSGVALEWEFRAQESKLKATSSLAQRMDDWIQKVYSLYTLDNIDGGSRFPIDFQPNSVSSLITDADKFLLMNSQNEAMNESIILDVFKAFKSGDDSPETESIIKKSLRKIKDLINKQDAEETVTRD